MESDTKYDFKDEVDSKGMNLHKVELAGKNAFYLDNSPFPNNITSFSSNDPLYSHLEKNEISENDFLSSPESCEFLIAEFAKMSITAVKPLENDKNERNDSSREQKCNKKDQIDATMKILMSSPVTFSHKFCRIAVDTRPFLLSKKNKGEDFTSFEKYLKYMSKLTLYEMKAQIKTSKRNPEGPSYSGFFRSTKKRTVSVKIRLKITDFIPDYTFVNVIYTNNNYEDDCFYGITLFRGRTRKGKSAIVKVVTEDNVRNFKLNSNLQMTVVCRLGTSFKEYEALHLLATSSFRDIIVGTQGTVNYTMPCKQSVLNLCEKLEINESQSTAINVCLDDNNRYVLIQGPPGTGKTQTTIKLICEFLTATDQKNCRILVCAPSNYAVDVLCKRISVEFDSKKLYKDFRIIRFGLEEKIDFSLYKHTLQSKLDYIGFPKYDANGDLVHYPYHLIVNHKINILRASHVIFSTLGSSASKILQRCDLSFDYIIVDESTQSMEASTIVPLRYYTRKFVLIGDDKQLPPTVISENARLKRSLFQRSRAFCCPILLNVQYRMCEKLIYWPNQRFYSGKLETGPLLCERLNPYNFPDHSYFVDIEGTESPDLYLSFSNDAEAQSIAVFVCYLIEKGVKQDKIGIITPYQAQKSLIKAKCQTYLRTKIKCDLAQNESDCVKDLKYGSNFESGDAHDLNFQVKGASTHSNSIITSNEIHSSASESNFYDDFAESDYCYEQNMNETNNACCYLSDSSVHEGAQSNSDSIPENEISNYFKPTSETICAQNDDFFEYRNDKSDDNSCNIRTTEDSFLQKPRIEKSLSKQKSVVSSNCQLLPPSDIKYEISSALKINTVDSFQGQEKDIIIFSAVRTKKMGFVGDPRRLNVALTRAKFSCIIFGNCQFLSENSLWSSLIKYYREQARLFEQDTLMNTLN